MMTIMIMIMMMMVVMMIMMMMIISMMVVMIVVVMMIMMMMHCVTRVSLTACVSLSSPHVAHFPQILNYRLIVNKN